LYYSVDSGTFLGVSSTATCSNSGSGSSSSSSDGGDSGGSNSAAMGGIVGGVVGGVAVVGVGAFVYMKFFKAPNAVKAANQVVPL